MKAARGARPAPPARTMADVSEPVGTNLRDLGGLPAAGGRRVRPRTLFRSEAPATLAPERLAELAGLPLRLVVDLRDGRERERTSPWPPGAEPEILNLRMAHADSDDAPDMLGGLRGSPDGAFAAGYMRGYYDGLPELFGRVCLPELVTRIGVERQVPVLVHCMAGQDRTGIAVAVLLLAVGVSRETVMADYMVTLEHFDVPRLETWVEQRLRRGEGPAIDPEAIAPLTARAEYLERSLDALEAGHGSVDAYLRDFGVDDDAVDALRATLLEDP